MLCCCNILRNKVFWVLLVITSSNLHAQKNSAQLDSLLLEAQEATQSLRSDEAITESAKLIEWAEPLDAYSYLFNAYNLLGENHSELNDSLLAGEYSRKALEHAIKSTNDTLISTAYNNLANLLGKHGTNQAEVIEKYQKALEIARKSVRFYIATPALNLAAYYYKIGEYEMMPRFLREAEENIQGMPYDVSQDEIRLNILWGDYFDEVGGPNLVAEYYGISHNLIKNKNDTGLALEFYPKYAAFLFSIDSTAAAYQTQLAYQDIKDRLEGKRREEEVRKAMVAAGADELRRQRNEAELREMLADEKLDRKNTQYTLMFILTGLMLFFLIYLYVSTRMRKGLIEDLKCKNTELIAAKETAEFSVKAKSDFFSTVSHEMRTPLYGVTGIVNVLQNSEAAASFKEEFNSLKFSALHLLDIINDLLELSKLDDESFEFNEHPFQLDVLMQEIVNSFSQSQLKNSNKIHLLQSIESPVYLKGDSRRIAQVLINLVSNAIKFTQYGDIYIRLSSKEASRGYRTISFEIEDTGKGISKSNLPYIFKEFNQVETPGADRKIGTGLGLAIVQKILHRMGSEISVESELDKGTVFSFSLSLKEVTADALPLEPLVNKLSLKDRILENKKILIVDDNKVNRLVTKRLLEQKNIAVATAQGGEEALELLSKTSFDLILMDLQMPGMDGFETVKNIRTFDMQTPIIALTASEVSTQKERLLYYGFNDSVTKPFDLDDFYALLVRNLTKQLVPG